MPAFDADSITDAKRLVRGETLLQARGILRVRHAVHNAKWDVLVIAGGQPEGEIRAIREVFPKARIVAVDIDEECLVRAIEAGVDDVICCDLLEPSDELMRRKFDLAIVDLCSNSMSSVRKIVGAIRPRLWAGSPMSVTFSYGRDVVELANHALNVGAVPDEWLGAAHTEGLSARAIARVAIALPDSVIYANDKGDTRVRTLFFYKGAQMPMCSILFVQGQSQIDRIPMANTGVLKIGVGDFELAVAHPDPSLLYDCPQDRIAALRRTHAAIKAAYTRKARSA